MTMTINIWQHELQSSENKSFIKTCLTNVDKKTVKSTVELKRIVKNVNSQMCYQFVMTNFRVLLCKQNETHYFFMH